MAITQRFRSPFPAIAPVGHGRLAFFRCHLLQRLPINGRAAALPLISNSVLSPPRRRRLSRISVSIRSRVAPSAIRIRSESPPPACAHRGNSAALDQANWLPVESGFEEEANDRFLRGRALEALDRDAEALTSYRTIAQRATHELVYVAPSRLREALLAGGRDDQAGATGAFEAAARLWSDADASLRTKVVDTGTSLRRLGVRIPAIASAPGR